MDVKVIKELLLWGCQRAIRWQHFHLDKPSLTLSSDVVILPIRMGSASTLLCFGVSAAKSIQPGCKACTHVLMNMCAHCIPRTFPSLVLSLIHFHTYTHGQAAMGGGNARNAPNPGLVFWLVPDFMPSPPGSVARPPCARPTGSNTRPGQPSSSSRPIINQQAALQLTSLPPSSHQYRGLLETQRKNIQPHTAACRLGCSGRLLGEEVLMISISLLAALCLNTQFAFRPYEFPSFNI